MEISAPKRRKLSLTNGKGRTQESFVNGFQISDDICSKSNHKLSSQYSTLPLVPSNSTLTPTSALPRSLQRRNSVGQTDLRRNIHLASNLVGGTAQSSRAKSMEPLPPEQGLTYTNGKHNGDSKMSAGKRGVKRAKGGHNTPLRSRRIAKSDLRASSPERLEADGDASDHVLSNETFAVEASGATNSSEANRSLAETGNRQTLTTPRRSHGITFGMSIGEDGEPSLPSTPVQLGLEKPPQPPRGLSSSSPRRRDRRKTGGVSKSSPLKNGWDAAASSGKGSPRQLPQLGPRIYIAHTPRPPPLTSQCIHDDLCRRLLGMEEHLTSLADGLIHGLLVCGRADGQDQEPRIPKAIVSTQIKLSAMVGKVRRLRHFIRQSGNGAITNSNAQCVQQESSPQPLPIKLSQRLARLLPFSERSQSGLSKPLHDQPKENLQPSATAPVNTDIDEIQIACCDIELLDGMPEDSIRLSLKISFWLPCDTLRCDIYTIINAVSNRQN